MIKCIYYAQKRLVKVH